MFKPLSCLLLIATLLLSLAGTALAEDYTLIDHAELKSLVDSDLRSFLLVDARTPEEYRDAHIPGAINIPANRFDDFAGLLPADKNSRLVFYCNGVKCGKSKKAAAKAIALGYGNVQIFAEGMPVWEELGYSFYKGGDYEKRIETTLIRPAELQALAESQPGSLQIVDVRDATEFAEGHIPGAINCPLEGFAAGSGILDKEKKVVVYCNSGGRSYGAYRKLLKLGYKNIAQAIFADWKEAGLPVEM